MQRKATELLSHAQVVNEEQLPDVGTVGKLISELFAPHRPLRPVRQPRKAVTAFAPDECNLLIRVVRAIDIPVREAEHGTRQSSRALGTSAALTLPQSTLRQTRGPLSASSGDVMQALRYRA